MLKIDFFGLRRSPVSHAACEAVKKMTGTQVDWVNLPLDDPETFHLLHQGATLGVFQMESGGHAGASTSS